MSKSQSLQDPYLNALRKERVPVSVYLVNGIKLQGQIESFDAFVLLLRNNISQMVYKHAISTIVPARNVRINLAGSEEETADEALAHNSSNIAPTSQEPAPASASQAAPSTDPFY